MDYSRFQVKYINNNDQEQRSLEIPQDETFDFDIPDISNISYLNGEAQPATALIEEDYQEPTKRKKK